MSDLASRPWSAALALLVVVGAELAALGALLALGHAPWARIPTAMLAAPADLAAALLRWLAVAAAAWLLTATSLEIVAAARVPRPARTGPARGALGLPPAVRRVVRRGIGAALSAALVSAPAAAVAAPAELPRVIPAPGPLRPGAEHTAPAPESLPTPHVPARSDADPTATPDPDARPGSDVGGASRSAPPPGAPPPASDHTTLPGEHLWSIAGDRLARDLGRAPTLAEHARYWRRVVALNARLLPSHDPDLIFPGDVVRLPAIDSAAG